MIPCTCRYCGESFSSAGIKNHETWCDQNPRQGVPPDQQDGAAVDPDTEREAPDTDTNPYQEETAGAGTLPEREIIDKPNKDTRDTTRQTPDECPNCGSTDTMAASRARKEYERADAATAPPVVLAYRLSERYCNECYCVWGDEYPDPTRIDVAVESIQGGA